MNKKKIRVFSFIICLLSTILAVGFTKTFAATPAVIVSGDLVDTIENIRVSSNEGGSLNWNLEQWATFRIDADFNLVGKNVKAGDETDMTIPDALIITSDSFDIRDVNTDEVIAHATVDATKKQISLIYTNYVTTHSDISGSFYFYARIDFKKHPQQGDVPVAIKVNNDTKVAGKVTFNGVGNGTPYLLSKTSWVNDTDYKTISYKISVNRTNESIQKVTVEDHLQFTNASYVPGSIRVFKGNFSFVNGEWQFTNQIDVTNQHPVTISGDGQSFVADLGDISGSDQYQIVYDVHLNYSPVSGEVLKNEATLKGTGTVIKNTVNSAAIQIAQGFGAGYVFSIHIHKVDDASQPLAGAKFKIVRQANNQVIGEYVTDANGNITVNGLLKDKYILTETEAPSGHIIQTTDTEVNIADFGVDHSVTKIIVNPKDHPTPPIPPIANKPRVPTPPTPPTTDKPGIPTPSTPPTTDEPGIPTPSTPPTTDEPNNPTPSTPTSEEPKGPSSTVVEDVPNDSVEDQSKEGRFLPATGEVARVGFVIVGLVILSGAIILKRKFSHK